jgi:hypothetical protein
MKIHEFTKGVNIPYYKLEELAFDTNTPAELVIQYQGLLKFLKDYMPDREFREQEIDKCKLLKLQENGQIIYSEVG